MSEVNVPMTSESQKRAQIRYDAANTKQIHLKLNIKTDADILERLEQISLEDGGKQGYIKSLIREDIIKRQ